MYVSHQRKISLFFFFFAFTHAHTHTIFLSNYYLSFLLYFATLIKVSQILLDLCFLQKSLSNKSRTLLSLSLHYLPSDFFFFLFLLISHSILQIFYSPIGWTVLAKAIKLFAAPSIYITSIHIPWWKRYTILL